MVTIEAGIIQLHTRRSSYIISTSRQGLAELLYYGPRIRLADAAALRIKANAGYGTDTLRSEGEAALSSLCLELSPHARGDYRRGALLAEMPGGGQTSDFTFQTATLHEGAAPSGGMPQGRSADQVVALSFSEPGGLCVELFYSVYEEADVIGKKMRITNRGAAPLRLLRAASHQLDLPGCAHYSLSTLQGAWAREFHLEEAPLRRGTALFGSGTGSSSHRCNPFFFLSEPGATESHGRVYGFNLVYSGSHEATVEQDTHGLVRITQGLWSEGFSWPLAPGESFITPQAVLTVSGEGKTGMSHNMHRFVRNHILPSYWRERPRPVLLNNWEGTYFDFTEGKLLSMARTAAKLGVELFVLDDGWFGRRTSDKAGLGDYDVNPKKLPSGLAGLARKLKGLGLQFGLWFEPEMVSEDSRLYEAHPGWAIATPGYPPAKGRHQLVLDLCRPEVRRYIIEEMGRVLDSAAIRYVKWDMNRHISDAYSPALSDQGSFFHRYTLGLYELFEAICATRPDVLFEGCASGGNRFDLGVLYYMPQIWLSDDTDAHERQRIQTGASYGYPPCTMGCHVSAVPNHQTLRRTPLETRFNTAAFGLLGYELDPRTLSRTARADIRAQISFYKQHRQLLQYGEFYRLGIPGSGQQGGCRWMVRAPDGSKAILGDFIGLIEPNSAAPPLRFAALCEDRLYRVQVRGQKVPIAAFGGLVNFVLPVHLNPDGVLVGAANKLYRLDTEREEYTAYGSLLCHAGLQRLQNFSGAGYDAEMRLLYDFSSRLYIAEAADTIDTTDTADTAKAIAAAQAIQATDDEAKPPPT